LHVIFDESRRCEEWPGRREIVVALAAEPIGAQARPIGTDLYIAARYIVGGHEAGDVIERARGGDALAGLPDRAGDLRFPIDLRHAARDRDVVVSAGEHARRLEEEIRPRGR